MEIGIIKTDNKEQENAIQEYSKLFSMDELKLNLNRGIEIKVKEENQTELMLEAKNIRLNLKKIRSTIENRRKELKEGINLQSKAIDGMANVLKGMIVPVEDHLEQQEKYIELLKEKRLQETESDRKVVLSKYVQDVNFYNLREISEEGFEQLLEMSKTAFEARLEAEKKANLERFKKEEEARLEAEKKEIENKKIREENEKLKKEKQKKDLELALEKKAKEKLEMDFKKAEEEKEKAIKREEEKNKLIEELTDEKEKNITLENTIDKVIDFKEGERLYQEWVSDKFHELTNACPENYRGEFKEELENEILKLAEYIKFKRGIK